MQLQLSFFSLLASFFIILSAPGSVIALPLSKRNAPGTVSLPLQRVPLSNKVHPQVLLQQHLNRSHRRLARMTGQQGPSSEELEHNLVKRFVTIEGLPTLEKRFSRYGVPKGKSRGGKSLSSAKNGQGGGAGGRKSKGKDGGNDEDEGGDEDEDDDDGANSNTSSNKGDAGSTAGGKGNAGNTTTTGNTTVGNVAVTGTTTVSEDNVTKANNPTFDNTLGLDIEANDVGYIATVQMGTPPRDFRILMDSGSADLWVGAENCVADVGGTCGDHTFLGPASSSSFVDTQAPFTVTYGTGKVSGSIINDNVAIDDLALNALKFGVATTESVEFSDNGTPFDGIMGLAKSQISEQKTLTSIEALAQQNIVNDAIIGYKISRFLDAKNDGQITFGGVDPNKFDPATVTVLPNVNVQGFWEAAMGAVSVDGKDLQLNGRTAILDTGTTLIVAPVDDAQAIHDAIPGARPDGQGGFLVPCTNQAVVSLTFGGQVFTIDPRDIAFLPVDPNNQNGDCVSGIAAGNIGGPQQWLVGDVFLKNAYFSTNVLKDELSLAKLV